MAAEEEKSSQATARGDVFEKISKTLALMDLKTPRDAIVAAPAIADLARAWRYATGGQQPGGGCNCSGK